MTDIEQPCQCHRNLAYIAPTHSGHCCFQPATRACHPAEVADWRERYARWHAPTGGAGPILHEEQEVQF